MRFNQYLTKLLLLYPIGLFWSYQFVLSVAASPAVAATTMMTMIPLVLMVKQTHLMLAPP